MRFLVLVTLMVLAACSRSPAPAPAVSTAPAEERAEPANPDFIGRVWIATARGSPRGSMLIFLPDRSLVMDSCFETYRISQWGVAGDNIRWVEDSIPIEARVQMAGKDEMMLQIAGREAQTYIAASAPYVCPDMPR